MPIRGEGLVEDGHEQPDSSHVVYVLHPNCAIEEI
jgi:hypothetical protein